MTLLHTKQDYLLAPLYYIQGVKVAKTALRLPEPDGIRQGITCIHENTNIHEDKPQSSQPSNIKPNNPLKLAIFGDSAGAGVGVDSQENAPLGRIVWHLCRHLSQNTKPSNHPTPSHIQWQLCATSGHTSFDLLTRLYAMPRTVLDIAIISIGVNDVIKQTTDTTWQQHLQEIIILLQRKFTAQEILFLSLPPMQLAPSLPTPLNTLIGRRASTLSQLLQAVCADKTGVHYLQNEFAKAGLTQSSMFAKDGFHPSKLTYDVWSQTIARALFDTLQSNQSRV